MHEKSMNCTFPPKLSFSVQSCILFGSRDISQHLWPLLNMLWTLDTPLTGIMLRSWLWCQSSTNVSPWRLGIWGANPMDWTGRRAFYHQYTILWSVQSCAHTPCYHGSRECVHRTAGTSNWLLGTCCLPICVQVTCAIFELWLCIYVCVYTT